MHVDITVKRHKEILGKQYIDIQCIAQSDSQSADIDKNIFVMQKLPKNALNESTARFSHIADPVDLQDYPAYEMQDAPYFRANEITLRVRSQFQVSHIISVMQDELQKLKSALTLAPISEEKFTLTL